MMTLGLLLLRHWGTLKTWVRVHSGDIRFSQEDVSDRPLGLPFGSEGEWYRGGVPHRF